MYFTIEKYHNLYNSKLNILELIKGILIISFFGSEIDFYSEKGFYNYNQYFLLIIYSITLIIGLFELKILFKNKEILISDFINNKEENNEH